MRKYFVIAHVRVDEQKGSKFADDPGGKDLEKRLGGGGGSVPFFAFLDAKGALIVNSNEPPSGGNKGGNIGHPAAPNEIAWFMEMLKRGAPAMTAEERTIIEQALRAQRNAELKEQVRQTEAAFAKTMADRDHAAFRKFLATEAVFISGGNPTRGADAVAARWKRFFEGPNAPFSWSPEFVEVLDSGTLALSSGPVRDPSGKRTGTFNSVWRREAGGQWKIVLDNGCPACDCAK